MKKLYDKKMLIMIIGGICLLIIVLLYYLKMEEDNSNTNLSFASETSQTTTIKTKNYVDIKGSVKNPGVYEFKENDRVIDQTTPNMIQRISGIFERNPLISKEI